MSLKVHPSNWYVYRHNDYAKFAWGKLPVKVITCFSVAYLKTGNSSIGAAKIQKKLNSYYFIITENNFLNRCS